MSEVDNDVRKASAQEARRLGAGDHHYMAYVGPPSQFDFMGASQFRLLTTLGLRGHHKLLDFGCGSLRAGRLFIPYLDPGNYFGLEPNQWLIDDAVDREIGRTLVDIKRPVFRNDDDFRVDRFHESFDFALAQSIFSHAGHDLVSTALRSMADCMEPDGLILATFIHPEQLAGVPGIPSGRSVEGWRYPGCVVYAPDEVLDLMSPAKLVGRAIPWFHPRQTWYALAIDPEMLPDPAADRHLSGAVLRDSEFQDSLL